jgi:ribosome-binding factor A
MPLGGEAQGAAIEYLARNKPELRRIIGRKAVLKFTPDLRFRLDETFDQMDETRRLFAQEKVRRDVEDE